MDAWRIRALGALMSRTAIGYARSSEIPIESEGGRVGFFETTFYGNTAWRWLVALGVIVAVWAVLHIVTRLIIRRLSLLAARTPERFDDLVVDLLRKTRVIFTVGLSLYAGSLTVALPSAAQSVLRILFILVLLLQAGYWGDAFVAFWIQRSVKRRLESDAETATTMSAVGFLAKLAIWAVVALLALDNLGIDITTLIAGLGIGGVALALGVQSILKDLFASLSILVDKPFVIGDFVVVGDLMGTVERIGLKTTRVRSLSGEQIIFANGDLLDSRVRNYKRMIERRVVFSFGVVYQTPVPVVEQIPSIVRKIVEGQSNVRFDRCHFKAFDDSALAFETVYYVLSPDYLAYMDVQQVINLAVMRAFGERGIEMAYPTQTVYLHSEPSSQNQ